MIIPSIDLQGGSTVQLIGGEEKALDAGDPRPLLDRFSRVGETAVIDLDAAIGTPETADAGHNRALIEELCHRAPIRVGGGIRSEEAARRWLDAGAEKIILGTAAKPELLSKLPKKRVIAALDARDGEVVVEGWRKGTGRTVLDAMKEIREYVDGFLVTFVECEGRMGGTRLDQVKALVEAAGDARVTIAGGVTASDEVAALDAMGADAQIGMALYTGALPLGDAFAAPLVSDRSDGLIATVVADESGRALGLCWSSRRSIAYAIEHGVGAYESRKRGLWIKGKTSGATQELLRIEPDCDRDALRFTVRQNGSGFCHLGTADCWSEARGLAKLQATLEARQKSAPDKSYAARLFRDRDLLRSKLVEEAGELSDAESREDVIHEAADVLFFAATAMARS
ncbi:MAG: phosphoribosyl-ATP pyrophosphohydrolase/phosphoribosyl-AMP cyclohydrolase, partial [Paracoccaceae bacterium]